jgi:hypothetical protein
MQNSVATVVTRNAWAAEIPLDPSCQFCGCRTAFAERAQGGQCIPFYRCCQCGRGRDDLKQFAA